MEAKDCRNCEGNGCDYCNHKGKVYAEVDEPNEESDQNSGRGGFLARLLGIGGNKDEEEVCTCSYDDEGERNDHGCTCPTHGKHGRG